MQPENPYETPVHVVVLPEPIYKRDVDIASRGQRFLNLFIDSFLVQILGGAVGVFFGAIYGITQMADGVMTPEDEAFLNLVGFAMGIGVSLSYHIILEAAFQRTLAKVITGTMVVTADGAKPSLAQIIGRSFARFIPFEAFSFLGSSQPVGWHDSLSNTRVIRSR